VIKKLISWFADDATLPVKLFHLVSQPSLVAQFHMFQGYLKVFLAEIILVSVLLSLVQYHVLTTH